LKTTLLASLDASNPGIYTASQAVKLGSTPDHSEEILQAIYKDDSLLNFLQGVASGSVSRMFVNLLETKNCIR
jgi:hypothetical protein